MYNQGSTTNIHDDPLEGVTGYDLQVLVGDTYENIVQGQFGSWYSAEIDNLDHRSKQTFRVRARHPNGHGNWYPLLYVPRPNRPRSVAYQAPSIETPTQWTVTWVPADDYATYFIVEYSLDGGQSYVTQSYEFEPLSSYSYFGNFHQQDIRHTITFGVRAANAQGVSGRPTVDYVPNLHRVAGFPMFDEDRLRWARLLEHGNENVPPIAVYKPVEPPSALEGVLGAATTWTATKAVGALLTLNEFYEELHWRTTFLVDTLGVNWIAGEMLENTGELLSDIPVLSDGDVLPVTTEVLGQAAKGAGKFLQTDAGAGLLAHALLLSGTGYSLGGLTSAGTKIAVKGALRSGGLVGSAKFAADFLLDNVQELRDNEQELTDARTLEIKGWIQDLIAGGDIPEANTRQLSASSTLDTWYKRRRNDTTS